MHACVTGQSPAPDLCSDGNRDALYNIVWGSTAVDTSDSKPCPPINGRETMGTAFRKCLQGSVWDSFINVSNCQTSDFRMLTDNAVNFNDFLVFHFFIMIYFLGHFVFTG